MTTYEEMKNRIEETITQDKASELICGLYMTVRTDKHHKNLTFNVGGLWVYGTHVDFDDNNNMFIYNGTTVVGWLNIEEVVETFNKKIQA